MSLDIQRFLEEPGAHVVLDENLYIIDAGPEYLRLTMTTRDDIIGRHVWDVFPERNKDTRAALQAAFDRAQQTLEVVKLPVLRYDIPKPEGGWAERYWRPTIIPVVENGKLRFFVNRVEDLTLETTTAHAVRGIRRSNYILYGLVLLVFMVVGFFFSSALQSNRDLSKHNEELAKTAQSYASETRSLILAGRQQRLYALSASCNAVNNLAIKLKQLIVASTVSSKAFENVFRKLGLPPYAVRLKTAIQEANSLKLINCKPI